MSAGAGDLVVRARSHAAFDVYTRDGTLLGTISDDDYAGLVGVGVRRELAALGGHLLATYGQVTTVHIGDGPAQSHPLATLGGYLLEHYGSEDAAAS